MQTTQRFFFLIVRSEFGISTAVLRQTLLQKDVFCVHIFVIKYAILNLHSSYHTNLLKVNMIVVVLETRGQIKQLLKTLHF